MTLFARRLDIEPRKKNSAADVPGETGEWLETALRLLPLFCAVLVLWLATRRYFGLSQDARFYALEALRALDPNRYAGDLYFQFGSQGGFSLFTSLYRPLVALFGTGSAGMGVAIAGQLLWLFGLWRLASSLVGRRFVWLSLALVIAVQGLYAPYLGYGEAFATPRLFAEALTMLALSLLRTRPALTAALLALAACLHPLMALPGCVAVFVYLALGRPIYWILAPAGIGLVMFLGWAGIEPFANLYKTLDPAWLAVARLRSLQCFVTLWPADAWFQVLNGFAWGAIGLFAAQGRDRRFLAAVLAAGLGGLVCTFVGADIAHNVLVVELQPWRAMWLVQVVVRIFIPVTLFSLLDRRIASPMAVAAALSVALVLVSSLTRLVRLSHSAEFGWLSFALTAIALAAILARTEGMRGRLLTQLLCGLAVAATPVAAWAWDARTPWTKFLEAPEPPPPDLADLLPRGASVYWEGAAEMAWYRLARPSYFSCDQGTGVVFHRETAMAYRHRSDSFYPLRTVDFSQAKSCAALDNQTAPERTRSGLQNLCRREPGLDKLVLIAPIDGVDPKIWKSPILFQDIHVVDGIYSARSTDRFYIYSCAGLR